MLVTQNVGGGDIWYCVPPLSNVGGGGHVHLFPTRFAPLGGCANLGRQWNFEEHQSSFSQGLNFPNCYRYACETRTLTQADCLRMSAFETWCWRRVSYYMGDVRNADSNQFSLKPYDTSARRDGTNLEVIMQGKVEGSRKQGRPKCKWFDQIKSLTGHPVHVI
jgi:hypothetical protein